MSSAASLCKVLEWAKWHTSASELHDRWSHHHHHYHNRRQSLSLPWSSSSLSVSRFVNAKFSIHRRKGSYFIYLTYWIAYLWRRLIVIKDHHTHHYCPRWCCMIFLLRSVHRRKSSYLNYLINWTIFQWRSMFFVLLSSAGLFSRSIGNCCFGLGHVWRLTEDDETRNHGRSKWRLRTPTICRRSVPA